MKGIYICARKHRLFGYDIDYNDIEAFDGINLCMDAYNIDDKMLEKYDFIIATPPCNYYSRANYRREISTVAQITKNLLPHCIGLCLRSGKPFIIENVCNDTLLPKADCFMFDFGQHTFYTNVFMPQFDKRLAVRQNKQHISRNKRDGNANVDLVIRTFLEVIYETKPN